MKKIYWWLFIVKLSLRWCFRYNIGDKVLYKGKVWILNQGVSKPFWDLMSTELVHVHESEFRKVWSIENMLGSFKSGYKFYMGYWYDIWCREGIKPWMRGCQIWAK